MRKQLFPLLGAVVLFSGCSDQKSTGSLNSWKEKKVTIQFRRDHLGSDTLVAPTTTWLNNTKVSLNGKIVEVYPDAVHFEAHYKVNSGDSELRRSLFWIPLESILTIEEHLAQQPVSP